MDTIATSLPSTTQETPVEPSGSVGGEFKEYAPLYELYGIRDKGDSRVNRNLETIWSYAKRTADVQDKESILWEITKLKHRIGDSPIGSAPYSRILAYVTTYNRMREAEKMLKEMEHA